MGQLDLLVCSCRKQHIKPVSVNDTRTTPIGDRQKIHFKNCPTTSFYHRDSTDMRIFQGWSSKISGESFTGGGSRDQVEIPRRHVLRRGLSLEALNAH